MSTAASGSTALSKLTMKPSSTKIRNGGAGKLWPLPLMLTVLVTSANPHACRATANGSIKVSDNVAVGHVPGKPVLERSLEAAKQLREYSFNSELLTYKKSKPKTSTGDFFFKKANQIRVQVTGSGMQAGSVVVRRADGVIRGKGGNGLSFLTMTLDPDSRVLMTPNDLNVTKSDFVSLLSGAYGQVSNGEKCRTGAAPIYCAELKEKVWVVDLLAPGKSNELSERIFLRTDNNSPAVWEIYKDGKLFSRAKFLNLKINPGLADSLFQM
jgi:outer membrane lipoprotein-sorting protein